MRYVVDHCVPAQVAEFLRGEHHQAWTAFEANLEAATDETLIIYADDKGAILVTNNKDCAALARRMCCTKVVYLRVLEVRCVEAMGRALKWMEGADIPQGRVLRVPLRSAIRVMTPQCR